MSKNVSCLTVFIFIFASCNKAGNGKETISDSLAKTVSNDTNHLSQFSDSLLVVSSGQMSPFKTVNIDNIFFQLLIDAQGDTSFIGTRNQAFMTPEGYKINTRLGLINKAYRDKLKQEPGWGYYIKLPSIWNLQFVVEKTLTDHLPLDTNRVTYIFKRR
jgi:hypothetical protein